MQLNTTFHGLYPVRYSAIVIPEIMHRDATKAGWPKPSLPFRLPGPSLFWAAASFHVPASCVSCNPKPTSYPANEFPTSIDALTYPASMVVGTSGSLFHACNGMLEISYVPYRWPRPPGGRSIYGKAKADAGCGSSLISPAWTTRGYCCQTLSMPLRHQREGCGCGLDQKVVRW